MQYDKWAEPKTYARERLNEICRKSEAYVGTPEEETNRIDIWGTQEQASRAARELRRFREGHSSTRYSSFSVWVGIKKRLLMVVRKVA